MTTIQKQREENKKKWNPDLVDWFHILGPLVLTVILVAGVLLVGSLFLSE